MFSHYIYILLLITPVMLFLAPLSSPFVLIFYTVKKVNFKNYFKIKKDLMYVSCAFILYAVFSCKSCASLIHLFEMLIILCVGIYSPFMIQHKISLKPYTYSYYTVLMLLSFNYASHGLLIISLNKYILHKEIVYTLDYVNRSIFFLILGIWPIVYCQKTSRSICTLIVVTVFVMLHSSESAKLAIMIGIAAFYISRKFISNFHYIFQAFVIIVNSLTPFLLDTFIHHPLFNNIKKHIPNSFNHRLYIWQNVLDLIYQKPIFGWGYDASKILSSYDNTYIALNGDNMSMLSCHPHSMCLQILLELGFIGLILYTIIWLKIIDLINDFTYGNHFKSTMYVLMVTYFVFLQTSYNIWASWLIAIIFVVYAILITAQEDKLLIKL